MRLPVAAGLSAVLSTLLSLVSAAADPPGAKKPPQTSSKVTYKCRHAGDRPPKIDGSWADEAAWRRAEPLKDFGVLRADGAKASKATTARLLWDEKNLYVAFACDNDGVRTKAVKRDDPVWEAEAAEVFLCPRGADAVYYEFNFSPKNVIYDSRVESWKYEDQAKNWQKWARGYNAAITSAAVVHRDRAGKVTGWSVEAAIPFKDFDVAGGKAPAVGDVWLFNAFRIAVKADGTTEYSHWQPVRPEFHRPHQFPRLEFVGR